MDFKEHLTQIFNKEKGLSYSALSAFLKSPSHYYRYVMEKEVTEAMEKGKRFHMAILEPELFKQTYFVLDDTEKVKEIGGVNPKVTTIYRDWKAQQLKFNEGKQEIKIDEYNTYQKMILKLKNHSVCKDILFGEGGENESTFEFYDTFKITGVIDRKTKEFTLDLKKVADADYQRVKWDIEKMNYDLQAVIYSKANRTKLHYLVFIDEGCNVSVVQIIPETLDRYKEKYYFALDSFQKCLEEDAWEMSYDFWQPLVRI